MKISSDLAQQRFIDLVIQFRSMTFPMEISLPDLCILISQLQLALRHPGNTGSSAVITRDVKARWITLLPAELADIMRLGDDPDYDL